MYNENKLFKSKTVELFGNKYEVSNKSSSSINNKFMLCIGFIKYHLLKINKIILNPLMDTIHYIRMHDFFEPIVFILCMLMFLLLFFTFIISYAHIDKIINTCNNECEIYKKYCEKYIGDKGECIRNNIYFYQVYIELFSIGITWYINALYYVSICAFAIGITINIIYFIFQLMILIYDKIYTQVVEFNEKIPDFELV